jgi:general secretion pathway protein E
MEDESRPEAAPPPEVPVVPTRPLRPGLLRDLLGAIEEREALPAGGALEAPAEADALLHDAVRERATDIHLESLRNFSMSGFEISSNLMLVIAQGLARRLCPQCQVLAATDAGEIAWVTELGRSVPERVGRAVGCEHCRASGYHGRIGIFEIWRIDPEGYRLLLQEADRRTLYRHLVRRGHRFMLDDGLEKVARGLTTIEELRALRGYGSVPELDRPRAKRPGGAGRE